MRQSFSAPVFVALLAGAVFVSTSAAAPGPPVLEHLYPVAAERGTTVDVTATGTFDPWPPQVWADAPGITFKPGEKAGEFKVEVAQDAAPGPHFVRFYNEHGASGPRFFVVAEQPETAETEPNDEFVAPQKIGSLPAALSGRLDRGGDVDCFAVTLKQNETLTAALDGYVLGSAFDGLLQIVDETGVLLAFNHDGRTLDPRLTWTAPRDGVFIVQIMGFAWPANSSVNFTGGSACVYRLHLQTVEPCAKAEDIAAEPEPESLCIPGEIRGKIKSADDEDRFNFPALKDKKYTVSVASAGDGSPLDAWLKIEDGAGKELARSDDAGGSRDPELTWTAPEDGSYTVAIGDVTHRGGTDYTYRLAISEAAPAVNATTASHSVTLKAGADAEVKVTVTRTNGFTAKLQLMAKSLPADVTAEPVDVPEKDGEVTLKISAVPAAAAAGQPIEFVLKETETGKEHPVAFFLTTTGENNGVPQGFQELLINSTPQLWLTVLPETPAPAEAVPQK